MRENLKALMGENLKLEDLNDSLSHTLCGTGEGDTEGEGRGGV